MRNLPPLSHGATSHQLASAIHRLSREVDELAVSGGGVPEAPIDGTIYGRQDAAWVAVVGGTVDWADITGKPATFPPSAHTHPAAQISDFSEAVDDRVGAFLQAGTNITLSYNDVANTLTIASTGGPASGALYIGDTAPGTPVHGQLWWDSDSGNTYIYYVDVNSAQWVQQNTVFDTAVTTGDIPDFAEGVDDRVAALLQPGANIALAYNDVANTLTISASGSGGGLPEAPVDTLAYGRKDAGWTRVLAITGDIFDGGNF
jgi:hypothetical protein